MPDGSDDRRHRRLETTYEETRTVLDAQREVAADVDRKATQTVRVRVMLVGVVATGIGVVGTELFDTWLLGIGFGSLIGSVVAGVATYSESNLHLGPSGPYRYRLAVDEFETTTWDRDPLATFATWIVENHAAIRPNALLLFITRILLLVGALALVLSVALRVKTRKGRVWTRRWIPR